jgi:CheY-like chemotaxis protein
VAERGAPDLAVLDVSMPGMDGLELLERLRTIDGMERLPAIFLSARVQPEDIEAGRALGATYLTKPFVATALLNAVKAALAGDDEVAGEGW